MRIKSVLINSFLSFGSYIIIFLLGLINRKIFITYLNIEFLGYEALFLNIFSLLALAEMGIGSVITYNLYQEIAANNKKEIAKLMTIYKIVYRFVGSVVFAIGLILFPFLDLIIQDSVTDWTYVRYIYIFYLIGTISTYFLAYRRTLFIANQMEFVCIKIDTVMSLIGQISKIVILIFTQNYILYLTVTILQNIAANLIISRKYNQTFSFVTTSKVTRDDYRQRNFFKDIGNFMIHKISYLIFGGVDNIVISMILGIKSVALFSNYMLIKVQLWALIASALRPIQASIGNLLYSEENNKKGSQMFFSLDLVGFFLASFVSISFFIMIQPFMELWLGQQYLLSLTFSFFLSFNIYIQAIQEFLYYFRSAFGKYEIDRKYMILSAVSNLTLSIVLAHKYGLSGVLIGTCFGLLFIWYGRMKVFYQLYLKISHQKYIIKHILWMLLAAIEGGIAYYLSIYSADSIYGFIIKIIICLFVPNVLNVAIFYRTSHFVLIKNNIRQIRTVIKSFSRR